MMQTMKLFKAEISKKLIMVVTVTFSTIKLKPITLVNKIFVLIFLGNQKVLF